MLDIVISGFLQQAEVSDAQREMKELLFKEEVLKKEKQLLVQFANHVSKIHSVKVHYLSFLVSSIVSY